MPKIGNTSDLSAITIASLVDLAVITEAEVSNSQIDPDAEIERSGQAHFLKLCQSQKVKPRLWLGSGPTWVTFVV